MPYREVELSLAAAGRFVVEPPGQRINAVSVTQLTPGGVLRLALGNNQAMRVFDPGVLRIGNQALRSDAKQGLVVENPTAQAGVTAVLLVSFTRDAENGPGAEDAITFSQA